MENLNSGVTTEVEIERVKEQHRSKEKDLLIREIPLTIFLNEQEFVTLFCSPQKLDCLAVGFLHLAGLLHGKDDLKEIRVERKKGMVFIKTGVSAGQIEKISEKKTGISRGERETSSVRDLNFLPGRENRADISPLGASLQVKAGELFELMASLLKASSLFKATGGVHSAALARPDKILFLSEDIGRHNAIDKIVGESILKNIFLSDKILLSSGRISSEVVLKGAKVGLPMIISHSAPTSLSVELAEKAGITLVGFVRGRRLNIYTHADRVVF